MITRADIVERASAWGLSPAVVEKDYVIGWLLWGIGSHPLLSRYWAFKGGTCLKKCFLETYRFSEDLDFSVLPGNPHQGSDQVFDEGAVREALSEVLDRVQGTSGIDLSARELLLKSMFQGRVLEGRLYYRGPSGSTQVAKVKLDISGVEEVVRPTVLVEIRHSFPDELPGPATVRTYAFEEVFAEKIRAMGQRSRPRDLYDIVNLYRHRGLGQAPALIQEILEQKCSSKGIAVPTFESVIQGEAREELESEWGNMLGHQLPALPPVELYLDELQNLFAWLSGELELDDLPTFEVPASVDPDWSPPPIVSTWDGAPVEAIRFAAANLLLVYLDYRKQGIGPSPRVVEPYSLRRSLAGHILLYARRPEEDRVKAYRTDWIEGVEVQRDVFEPLYPVEFTSGGAITARPTRTGRRKKLGRAHPVQRRWAAGAGSAPYAVECISCGRIFRRSTPSTRLRPHKKPSGFPCPGTSGIRK